MSTLHIPYASICFVHFMKILKIINNCMIHLHGIWIDRNASWGSYKTFIIKLLRLPKSKYVYNPRRGTWFKLDWCYNYWLKTYNLWRTWCKLGTVKSVLNMLTPYTNSNILLLFWTLPDVYITLYNHTTLHKCILYFQNKKNWRKGKIKIHM